MDFLNLRIETDRLILRPVEVSDAEEKYIYFDEEIIKYMYPKPAESVEETKSGIKKARLRMKKGNEIQFAIIMKKNKEFIGCAGLHSVDCKTPEFGIWTKKSSHGNGYGREAMTALHDWACDNIDFDYILYPVDKRNIASRKIPESLGGVIAKEYKENNASGFELDVVEYHIYKK